MRRSAAESSQRRRVAARPFVPRRRGSRPRPSPRRSLQPGRPRSAPGVSRRVRRHGPRKKAARPRAPRASKPVPLRRHRTLPAPTALPGAARRLPRRGGVPGARVPGARVARVGAPSFLSLADEPEAGVVAHSRRMVSRNGQAREHDPAEAAAARNRLESNGIHGRSRPWSPRPPEPGAGLVAKYVRFNRN